MIAECERCHSKFRFPDDKAVGKRVRVRCSTCGHVFAVEAPAAAGAAPQAPNSASPPPPPMASAKAPPQKQQVPNSPPPRPLSGRPPLPKGAVQTPAVLPTPAVRSTPGSQTGVASSGKVTSTALGPSVAPAVSTPESPDSFDPDSFDPDSESFRELRERQPVDLKPARVPDLDDDPFSLDPGPPPPVPPSARRATTLAGPPRPDPSAPPSPVASVNPIGGLEFDFEFSGPPGPAEGPGPPPPAPQTPKTAPPPPPPGRPQPDRGHGDANVDTSFFDDDGAAPPDDLFSLPPATTKPPTFAAAPSAPSPLGTDHQAEHQAPPPHQSSSAEMPEAPQLQLASPFFGAPAKEKPRPIAIHATAQVGPSGLAVLLRAFLALLFVVGALATYVLYKNGWKLNLDDLPRMVSKAFGASRSPGLPEGYTLSRVKRAIYENAQGKRLLIVGGRIDHGNRPRPRVAVVKLFDEQSILIDEKEATVGRVFDAAQLNALTDPRSLEDEYRRLRVGDGGQVPADGDGAFMAVFLPVPEGVENRRVFHQIDFETPR